MTTKLNWNAGLALAGNGIKLKAIFEGYIDNNVNNVANQIMSEGGQSAIDTNYLQNNFDKFRELLFRNATWGYLYRVVEEQSK